LTFSKADLVPSHLDGGEEADGYHIEEEVASAIGHKGEGQPGDGQEPGRHPNINEDVKTKDA
jgi:hypothetical protein